MPNMTHLWSWVHIQKSKHSIICWNNPLKKTTTDFWAFSTTFYRGLMSYKDLSAKILTSRYFKTLILCNLTPPRKYATVFCCAIWLIVAHLQNSRTSDWGEFFEPITWKIWLPDCSLFARLWEFGNLHSIAL
jgi:hypothetical protein